MANDNVTSAALVWTGLIVVVSHGWLTNVRDWINTHAGHGGSGTATAATSQPSAAAQSVSASQSVQSQMVQALSQAGFTGVRLATMAAIAQAESGLRADARNVNTDGTVDRGWFQFNSHWHPEVSDACAADVFCAAKAAYKVSNGGSTFTAWSAYKNGAYSKFLAVWQNMVSPGVTAVGGPR